jgi:hypothetical protein
MAVSDCGSSLTAEMRFDARGFLSDLVEARLAGLTGPDGRALGSGEVDAESLARLPDGSFVVGFEGHPRLWRYGPGGDPLSGAPQALALPPEVALLPSNQGLETIVALAGGRLLLIAEGASGRPASAPAWLQTGSGWQRTEYPLFYSEDAPAQPFRPTDAALLPSGDIVVLERRYPPLAVRLRQVAVSRFEAGGDLAGVEMARIGPPLTLDNFEGLDVNVSPGGKTRLYLISDDNDCVKGGHRKGTSRQRTLLLAFEIQP